MDEEAEEIQRGLQKVSLFSDVLTAEQLRELALDCSPFFFGAGSILIRQGDLGTSMFCIRDGFVSITFVDSHDQRREIRKLGANNVVGEIELLTGGKRLATVTAVTDVRALEIPKQALEKAFAKAPDLMEGFASVLAIRQAVLRQIKHEQSGPLQRGFLHQIRKVFLP